MRMTYLQCFMRTYMCILSFPKVICNLQTYKKRKNDIILINVKTSYQMEYEKNQLGLGETQVEFLLLELEREQALGPNPHISMDV